MRMQLLYINELKGTNCTHLHFVLISKLIKCSRLLSMCRVLPLDHLWQALFLTFHPTNTTPRPTCGTKQRRSQQRWICHTALWSWYHKSFQWHAKFKFRTLFVRLVTQTHIPEMETGAVHAWRKEDLQRLTRTEASLSFSPVLQHWHRYQRTKQTRPSEASLPVLWEGCSDSWQLD